MVKTQFRIYPREVAEEALSRNAAAIILAHNHPSGIAEPSQADQRITDRLKSALLTLDIRVLDHIIVGSNSTISPDLLTIIARLAITLRALVTNASTYSTETGAE